jgi:serpin B
VDVPMMYRKAMFKYADQTTFKVLELPYKGDQLSMVVLLPKSTQAKAMAALEKTLSTKTLNAWLRGARKREIRVYLPRFKMTSEFSLKDTLVAMGMKDAFTPGKANFSGMDGTYDLFISAVVHKAFVDVNEQGTEAAAATAVVMGLRSAPARPLVFRADRPFIFLIRDTKTGSILFIGRVMNPKK